MDSTREKITSMCEIGEQYLNPCAAGAAYIYIYIYLWNIETNNLAGQGDRVRQQLKEHIVEFTDLQINTINTVVGKLQQLFHCLPTNMYKIFLNI